MDKKNYEEPTCLIAHWEEDVITNSKPYVEGEGEKDIFG